MELNFSKKTRKIVASLLAVAILLGVLPVSGLTGNSSGAEGNNGSANTIFVKSDHQPVLFDSNGNVKSVLTKKDGTENVYTATPENGDKIGVFKDKDFGTGKSIVFFKSNEWTSPHVYLWNGANNNGEFPGPEMTKLSDGIYYSVYQSNTYKQAVFNNGNKNEKTGDLTLIDFGVYVHNSDGSISNESSAEYFNCVDYKESNNVYEFTADSNTWKEANVNKPTPNVTISGNGKDEVKVIENGEGKDVSYTYYSNQKVVANASNVTGFTASEVEYSNNVYSVTYTSNEYNFISYEFTSGTVSFEELDDLTVTGEWKVYDGDKEISDDTVVKVTGDEKITAKYELTSAEYQGNKVSEDDLKIALQLNDKDYSNGSEIMSADLNPKNKLSGKAEYNGQTANIETYTFNCDKAKKVSVDKNDATDGNLYITGTRIYSSEASAEVKIGYVEDAKYYSIKVKSGDSDKNIPSITKTGAKSFSIGNIDKIGDSTVTLTASYTLHDKEISKDFSLYYRNEIKTDKLNITYSNTGKDTTGKDIRTWVSAESAKNNPIKVYFDFGSKNENGLIKSINYFDDLKAKYDENIGKWYVEIKEAKTYDFKVTDQVSNTSNITINEADLYIDKTAPKITSFKFESVSSEKDKLFSFLTFGIYHNDNIKVTVSAVDNGYSSGLKDITLSEESEDKSSVIEADPTGELKYDEDNKIYTKSFILSSVEGAETAKFKLLATATDNVDNKDSKSVLDDDIVLYKGNDVIKINKDNFEIIKTIKPPTVENITLAPASKSEKASGDNYSGDVTLKFTAVDDTSALKEVKVVLDENTVLEKDFTRDKTNSAEITYSTENIGPGEHTLRIYVTNNAHNELSTQKGNYIEKTFYVDATAPKVTSFKFEDGSDDGDKLLSFLTFGIYHNDKIKVTVTAEDPDKDDVGNKIASSGVKSITLYNGENDSDPKSVDVNEDNQATFTVDNSNNAYRLFAKSTDNVNNESQEFYTFIYTGNEKDKYDATTSEKAPELVSYNKDDKFSLTVTPENFTHQYQDDDKNLFSYEVKGEAFKLELSESLSSLSKAVVSVKKDGVDGSKFEKELNDVFYDKTYDTTSDEAEKENCKLDYELKLAEVFNDFGVSGSDISGNYTITVEATNNANVSKTYTYDFSIDNTAPKVTSFSFTKVETGAGKLLSFLTFGIYSNSKIKVTVTADDPVVNGNSSGVKSITLYNGKNPIDTKNVAPNNQAEFILENNESAYHIFAQVDDNFDNKCGYWSFVNCNNNYDINNKEFSENSENSENKNELILNDKLSDSNIEVVSTDKSAKIEDISAKPSNSVYKSVSGKDFYSGAVTFTTTITNELSGIRCVSVKNMSNVNDFTEKCTVTAYGVDNKKIGDFNSLNAVPYSKEKIVKLDIEFTAQTSDLKEGKNEITITTKNNSGNTSDKSKTIYLDTNTPEVTNFTFSPTVTNNSNDEPVENKNAYGYYVNQKTRVTVTATDTEDDTKTDVKPVSGVKEIFYKAVDFKGKTILNESKSVNSNNSVSFDVEPNFKGYIYAYAVDNVYNGSEDAKYNGKVADKREFHPDGLVVENGEMHAKSSGITATLPNSSYSANGNPLYSGDITIPVTVTDSYSGIKQIEYSVKSNYDTQNNQSQTVDIANSVSGSSVGGWSFDKKDNNLITQMSRNITVKNNSNDIVLTVKLTDRAGNETKIEKKFSIDKTKPVIDVKYDNNEHTTYGGNDYYKADRTATVTVTERNFDESLVEAAIMRNGGRYTTIGGWTHNNNTADPDKSTHVAKIVYNTDGDFTFDIAVKDKAMNSADKFTQQKFTVDKTAPVIDVSFDNNSAKNGNYYKADRTATIKITEHNFNSGSQYVNIPVTAEGTTAPSVVGWSGSGDDHNATVSFNKDGKYSFTVDYTDLAGNKAVQKKVDSFYIDKTAPEVEITGVADHQAYNGTVAPVVTYRDDNFTDDHDFKFTKINIDSKVDDTSKFDYDTGGNGVTEFIYKYRDFAEVLENDGIYNFTVELSDKAGNSTSKSVTFSVNRFGSTFRTTDEPTEKLIKNGYTNAEQDIVVEEINVSPLTKHSVTLAKSGGNSTELVENTDYTFTSSNNSNEWCKSVYTVNKKNFSDEAAYTVTIMSVDKAKNTNNNRMASSSLSTEQKNKREYAISFVVDKTSPLVSITGIKDNELYKEASKKVKIVCEDDNLDKSKLVVTLDNKKLAEGEDYTIVDDKDGSIAGMLTAEIVLKAETGGIKENLKVTVGDLAGNTGEKSVDNFILSANIFQRFFANPVLVICTFAGLALVIAAVIFFVAKKRKKAE